jgi:hypothetical protein
VTESAQAFFQYDSRRRFDNFAAGECSIGEQSLALPMVSTAKLVEQMVRCESMNETSWIRLFWEWVRGGMQ